MNNEYKKYDDIINLPHHVSKRHQQMSLEARSAQFAPFATLTGYNNIIQEAARLTSDRKYIDEEQKLIIDSKIQIIQEKLYSKPTITITYFKPDIKKEGGMYLTVTGNVKKVDKFNKLIILEDGTKINILEVVELKGNIFVKAGFEE